MKEIKNLWKKTDKIYFCNFVLVFSLIMSIFLNFVMQFQVENLQDRIEQNKSQISYYKDQISLLDVEWAYMTRPSRLRELSSNYLKDNGYTLASQIKQISDIESQEESVQF